MLENNMINENISEENKILTEGGEFTIVSPNEISRWKICNYKPKCTAIVPDDIKTTERIYMQNDNTKTKTEIKVPARILYIEEDKVGIEVFFKEGKCQRILKRAYIQKLKNKKLLFVGAVFDIIYTEDEDGTSLKVMQKQNEPSEKVKLFYDNLLADLT